MLRPFVIHEPRSVEEASALLAEHGPVAAAYAGGTELLVVMKEGLAHFPHLINLKTIPGLRGITAEDGTLCIGALTTHREIERSPLVREQAPVLAALEAHVANIRVRHVGTLGGNLCFAEPHSDPATLLVALNATLRLASQRGEREIAAHDFFTGLLETAKAPDEILTEVRVPMPPRGAGTAYERFKTHERPIVTVATVIHLANGVIGEGRVVVGSVGPRPVRLPAAEAMLAHQPPNPELFAAVAERAAADVEIMEERFESMEYRRHLVRVLVARALDAAATQAQRKEHRDGSGA
ncbi:MAG: xanthine dehydrogenase FAD-binding subunit XdhB [Thermomicrobiales bacterium]|nr:MAG: xanthine dehydrogenase FAD-binding subunit XdhB [Thermomicrobiales bacterium]